MLAWAERFYRWGWVLFLLLTPMGGSLGGTLFFLVATALLGLDRLRRTTKMTVPENNINLAVDKPSRLIRWLFVILFWWGILSASLSSHKVPALALTIAYFLIVGLSFAAVRYILLFCPDKKVLFRKGQRFLAVGTLLTGLYTVYSVFIQGKVRGEAPFIGLNGLGTLLVLVGGPLLASLMGATSELDPQDRKTAALALFFLGVALVLTMSRGGWLGFMVMAILLFLRAETKWRRRVGSILVLMLLLLLTVPTFQQRFMSIFSLEKNMDRIYIWRAAVRMIKDHPITGIGVGNFPYEYARYKDMADPRESVAYAHNLLLAIGSELGLPALGIFLFLVSLLLARLYQRAKRGPFVLWGIFAALVGALTHQMVDNVIWVGSIAAPFWAALAFGLYWPDEQKQRGAERAGK